MQNNGTAHTPCTGKYAQDLIRSSLQAMGRHPLTSMESGSGPKEPHQKAEGVFLSPLSVTVIIGVVCNSSR